MSGGKLLIFCDIANGLDRASVWRGKTLIDLYIGSANQDELIGAVAGGRIVRVMPGEKAAFVDCGLDDKVYITASIKLKSGDNVAVRIVEPHRDGKAWRGELLPAYEAVASTGILEAAPATWMQALSNVTVGELAHIKFKEATGLRAYQTWLAGRKDFAAITASIDDKASESALLDEAIAGLLQQRIPLPGQSEIVIEETEALIVVDVNGPEAGNALAINLATVQEVARQIRLRNLSGIILIDALKMRQRADNAKLLNALGRAVAEDPAGVDVFGLTKLGLIEMVRRRRGAPLTYYLQKAGGE